MKQLLHIALLVALLFVLSSFGVAAQSPDLPVLVEIRGVGVGLGDVCIAIFDTADAFKKEQPLQSIIMSPATPTLSWNLRLPPGDYVVSAFQDSNGNLKLDKNFFGLPREPFALSNYDGKGIPGGFNVLKIRVEGDQQLLAAALVQF